jgi:exosortase E/protease (VPEID-CTERM system)
MSPDLSKVHTQEPARLPIGRWLCLGTLLGIEVLALSLRFDSGALTGIHAFWADMLGGVHILPQVAIAIAAATFLFGGQRLQADLSQTLQVGRALPVWPFVLGHLTAIGCFTVLTAALLESDLRTSPWASAWAATWAAVGAAALALWVVAALPTTRWWTLARRCAGPLLACVLIGLAAWGMGLLTDLLWVPLSRSTFWLVSRLLGLVTADAVCDPGEFIVGTSSFAVRISPECSGYEGIGLIWVFVGVYLWCQRRELRFPAALLLLPTGTAVVWVTNAVRIAGLVIVGTWVSADAARGGFHSQAGWLAFTAIALGVVLVARRVPWIAAQKERPAEAAKPDATAAYLTPLLVLVATMMITAAFVVGFDWAYPLRVVLTGAALWGFRRSYTDLHWSWSWTAVGLGAAVFVLWLALEPTAPAGATDAFGSALQGVPAWLAVMWLVFRVVGSVVTVPLAEELAFRGFLTRKLIASDFESVPAGRFTWLSFLVSSVLFGLLHGRWHAGALAGMAYALAYYRRGRLGDAVLAHAVTNALLAVYVLNTGAWSVW